MAETEILGTTEGRWPDPDAGPWTLRLTCAVVDDRPAVVGVEVYAVDPDKIRQSAAGWPKVGMKPRGTVPITTAGIRVPLAEKLAGYMARTRRSDEITANAAPWSGIPAAWRKEAERRLRVLESAPERRGPGRPPQYGPEHFKEVAALYGEALAGGVLSPTVAVARAKNVSESTAAKWVARCRRTFGLLPETTKGKAAGWPAVKKGRKR